ncbi:unnamed protein product, partial [Meganyctiphanes norvegica]
MAENEEIITKANGENQKKKKNNFLGINDAGLVVGRGRMHSWGGEEISENIGNSINRKKSIPEERNPTSKQHPTIKKAERPTAKTCKKVLPKAKTMIQVRVNYLNKNNNDKEDEI